MVILSDPVAKRKVINATVHIDPGTKPSPDGGIVNTIIRSANTDFSVRESYSTNFKIGGPEYYC